ncbi:DoxX family protein [Actinopolymorpha rutila]|uniref:Membrane-bound ClpP family serine protease n=1 Tax=Actinopolymorpha rutila TaxID=446787 RepID=A0A852ZVV7_9ACTN|nr:DoxX family protein [Actinopolymorpha rutila]NYH93449.1 membrane-bound ClpP family serine protease [Actinopolymorpha rutila]
MSVAHIVVTLAAAAWVGFSALAVFMHAKWVVGSLAEYGVPRSWWPWLGTAKAAGAVGLVVGLFVPFVGVAAGVGLILYFVGALITVVRARSYAHIPYPLLFLAPVAVALALGPGV